MPRHLLSFSRDGDSTTFLVNLCKCSALSPSQWKENTILLFLEGIPCTSVCAHCLLFCHWELRGVWPCLLHAHWYDPLSLLCWRVPAFSVTPHRRDAPVHHLCGPLLGLLQDVCLSSIGEAQNWTQQCKCVSLELKRMEGSHPSSCRWWFS